MNDSRLKSSFLTSTKPNLLVNKQLTTSSIISQAISTTKTNLNNPLLTNSILLKSSNVVLNHVTNLKLESSLGKKSAHRSDSLQSEQEPAKKPKTISTENTLLLRSSLNTVNKLLDTKSASHLKTTTALTISKPANQIIKLNVVNSLLEVKKECEKKVNLEVEEVIDEEMEMDEEEDDEFFFADESVRLVQDEFKRKMKQKQKVSFLESALSSRVETNEIQRAKTNLINLVSASLLKQPNFKDAKDLTRKTLITMSESVINSDPEFILKLALYTRRELNIRVTANFLLSLAAFNEKTRAFLHRFFGASVSLPSDWIDVAEQYQQFADAKLNFGALPSALRKCMSEKFASFDQYQLAKYNKEKSRAAKNKNLKDVRHVRTKLKDVDGNEVDDDDENLIVEDKYTKEIKNGLKINDRIYFMVCLGGKTQNVKVDVIYRKEKREAGFKKPEPLRTRRGFALKVKTDEKEELDEEVAVRFTLDFVNKRIVMKSFLNKKWERKDQIVTCPKEFDFQLTDSFNKRVFAIDLKPDEFVFNALDETGEKFLCRYLHSKHRIALNKLNYFRLSGAETKLKELEIKSKDEVEMDSVENEAEVKQHSFTLKQLIRQLHISKPVENVMALIGKKYPATFEEFVQSKLPGLFESERAGKRMKLPIPETWETQVSMHGNKAEVWEKLIDHKKLPYMAMLRNLRNMIKCGVSEKHHQWVLKKLQDEGAVVNSKQFPFRFFSAYEVLDELAEDLKKYNEWVETSIESGMAPLQQKTPLKKNKKEKEKKS